MVYNKNIIKIVNGDYIFNPTIIKEGTIIKLKGRLTKNEEWNNTELITEIITVDDVTKDMITVKGFFRDDDIIILADEVGEDLFYMIEVIG